MADDSVSATTVINAPPEAIFAVLADPAMHAAIDGTGWVRATLDSKPLTAAGQIFGMSMYHPNHPDGNFQTFNRVQLFDPPSIISWEHLGNSLAHLAELVTPPESHDDAADSGLTSPMATFSAHTASPPPPSRTPAGL